MALEKQYVLVVNDQRGFSGISLYDAGQDVIDVEQAELLAGGASGFTFQTVDPSGLNTFTVTVSRP